MTDLDVLIDAVKRIRQDTRSACCDRAAEAMKIKVLNLIEQADEDDTCPCGLCGKVFNDHAGADHKWKDIYGDPRGTGIGPPSDDLRPWSDEKTEKLSRDCPACAPEPAVKAPQIDQETRTRPRPGPGAPEQSQSSESIPERLARAWDEGYAAAEVAAKCWGHVHYWEDEPLNPFRKDEDHG